MLEEMSHGRSRYYSRITVKLTIVVQTRCIRVELCEFEIQRIADLTGRTILRRLREILHTCLAYKVLRIKVKVLSWGVQMANRIDKGAIVHTWFTVKMRK